ncbi:MAG: DUF1016 N-terminal domain-containing protein [Bacteroidota bacterium]
MSIEQYNFSLTELVDHIQDLVNDKKGKINKIINHEMPLTYWEVGRLIITRESENNIDQKSSRTLILELSKMLSAQIGKGFSRSNLTHMRLFYITYPNGVTVWHQLSKH